MMGFRLEMRQCMQCLVCETLGDGRSELPPTCRPHDPLTGATALAFAIGLGYCPACWMPLGAVGKDFATRLYKRFTPAATRFGVVAAKAKAMGWKGAGR